MHKSITAIAIAVVMLSGCSRDAPPTTMPIETVADFKQALKTAGVEVSSLESHRFNLPETPIQSWEVRGESIHIYSFNETSEREHLLDQITNLGSPFLEHEQELQIWERDSFVVIYPGSDGGLILLVSGLLGDPITRQVSGPDEPYPPAVPAAQHALADELGIPPSEVHVVDYEDRLWLDSCLEIVAPEEVCAQEETPGWRIELEAGGQTYVMHSDAIGQQMKRAE
ncbi:MAG: hypothetical protein PVH92_08160 [Anaerolineales bacterium]